MQSELLTRATYLKKRIPKSYLPPYQLTNRFFFPFLQSNLRHLWTCIVIEFNDIESPTILRNVNKPRIVGRKLIHDISRTDAKPPPPSNPCCLYHNCIPPTEWIWCQRSNPQVPLRNTITKLRNRLPKPPFPPSSIGAGIRDHNHRKHTVPTVNVWPQRDKAGIVLSEFGSNKICIDPKIPPP